MTKTIMDEMRRNWETARERAVARLEGKVEPWNPEKLNLYWKSASDLDLRSHLVFCLLTPQTRTAVLDRIYKSGDIKTRNAFHGMTESETARELRNMGVRFHHNKAQRVHRFVKSAFDIRSLLSELAGLSVDLRHERWARLILIDEVTDGLGLKVASLYLKDVGFASHLAVLDSQNFRFAQKVGLFALEWNAASLADYDIYYLLEEWEGTVAERLGVCTAAVDWPIMDASETE